MSAPFLHRLALLSVLAAIITIAMKTVAWQSTGSAGLLSDALESGVNLLAAGTAYFSLIYAARPADATHTFGHEKIEFFASGLEGVLILLAGLGAIGFAIERLFNPQPLFSLGIGSSISAAAAIVNLIVALILLRAGKRHRSIILEADAHHLLSDVWTTAAILLGLGLVALTGYEWIDSLLAIAVGINIMVTGFRLIRRSFNGLMDHALPLDQQQKLRDAIRDVLPVNADFHALRTRQAGRRTFAEFHLLVPGRFSVSEAHSLAHQVEDSLSVKFPDLAVTIHIEPIDEVTSFETTELKRLGERVPEPLPALISKPTQS
ncbi:cation diffusion facilitator family transporter [soil metagenome]